MRLAEVRRLGREHRQLLASSPVLTVQLAVLAAGGLLFWLVAARTASADEVGEASELYALVTVLNFATNLGLSVVVTRFGVDTTDQARRVFVWSLLLTTVGSVVGAVVTTAVVSADFLSPISSRSALNVTLLFLAVNAVSLATIVDSRQVGLGLHRPFVIRAGWVSVVRVGLLLVTPRTDRVLWIWLAATMPAGLGAVASLVRWRGRLGPYPLGLPGERSRLVRFSVVNYASTLLSMAPFVVLPLVVFTNVDAADNAVFYVPWQIAAILFFVPTLISRALLFDATLNGERLPQQIRAALVACAGFGVLATIGSLALVPLFPLVYGSAYDTSGAVLLGLSLALLPYGVSATALSVARVAADSRATIILSAVLTVAVLIPCTVWTPDEGAAGATLAWLVGHAICAGPAVWYLLSRPAMGRPHG